MNAAKVDMTFITANISSNYNVTHDKKRLTKVGGTNFYKEGVYFNSFIVQQPTVSIRIITLYSDNDGTSFGVAADSSLYTPVLHLNSWSYFTAGRVWDHNVYTITPYIAKVNDIVTLCVNLEAKTIQFKLQGNSTLPPIFMNISDSELQNLRPIVQLGYNNAVEIYP